MKVSAVSLGGWKKFGSGRVATDTVRAIVEAAYHQGVNFFDLADSYAAGAADEQVGQILSQFPRHTLVISTKAYWPMSDDVNDRGLSRKHLMESIEKSLRRLGTDYVDLYIRAHPCHRFGGLSAGSERHEECQRA